MKERLLKLEEFIDNMPLARRVMWFVGLAITIVAVAYFGHIEPLAARRQALTATMAQQRQQIEAIDAEMGAVLKVSQNDPDAVLRRRQVQVAAESQQATKSLQALQQGLVHPTRIVPLLQQILRSHAGLRVNALRSLPVESLGDTGFGPLSTATPESLLYRHGVEITVQGNYADLLSYMDALEKVTPRLIWGAAELSAIRYPDSSLKLTVYTLSLDETWVTL